MGRAVGDEEGPLSPALWVARGCGRSYDWVRHGWSYGGCAYWNQSWDAGWVVAQSWSDESVPYDTDWRSESYDYE